VYLPNGDCIECEDVADLFKFHEPSLLSDELERIIDGLKFLSNWRLEVWTRMKSRRNFNPPERWEPLQDKRRNAVPLGRSTYLYKARKIKSLARSTHPRCAPHRGAVKNGVKQCKHTFEITRKRCAPCSGYDTKCDHYKSDAADTKHHLTP
jgi:hypothetical protein